MKRFKMTVEYDGTNYHGFQIQPNGITVQETIETALFNLTKEKIKVVASGRTDTGTHALGQVLHFDSETNIPCKNLPLALAMFLPNDISVASCVVAKKDFHARFSAKTKTYEYLVCLSNRGRPILNNRCYIFGYDVDINKMKEAGKHLIGKHDFASFMASGSVVDNTCREVFKLSIKKQKDLIIFSVTANGFLYNMVRIIVGTLLDIGRGKIDVLEIDNIISARNRLKSGHTAKACGLYLKKVQY